MSVVNIELAATGAGSRVIVDGKDLSELLRGVTVDCAVSKPTSLTLYLAAQPVTLKGETGEEVVYHECPDCPGHGIARIIEEG